MRTMRTRNENRTHGGEVRENSYHVRTVGPVPGQRNITYFITYFEMIIFYNIL